MKQFIHFILVKETENVDLQCDYSNLKSLGICDHRKGFYKRINLDDLDFLNDNLNFINGRYETKFVWKANKNEL